MWVILSLCSYSYYFHLTSVRRFNDEATVVQEFLVVVHRRARYKIYVSRLSENLYKYQRTVYAIKRPHDITLSEVLYLEEIF